MISGSANGVSAKPATSVTQEQKTKTCAVLARLGGMEEYEITAFAVRCERATIDTKPEVPTDPTAADVLVATDPALAANAYRLLGMYKLAKDLGVSNSILAQQPIWYATVRNKYRSKDCWRAAYQGRLQSLTTTLEMSADSLPIEWTGNQQAAGCPDDRLDSFQLTYEIKGQEVHGKVVGSEYCTNKVFEIDFDGTSSGHLVFVTYEAGWGDEHQTAKAVIAGRNGNVYWEVLSPKEVEDYVWNSADTTRLARSVTIRLPRVEIRLGTLTREHPEMCRELRSSLAD